MLLWSACLGAKQVLKIVEQNEHPINGVKVVGAITKEKAWHLGNGTMNKPKVEKSLYFSESL